MNQGYMLNGKFVDRKTLDIDPLEPCFAHGHGLFETLRVQDGRAMFLVGHVERMRTTAAVLDMEFPTDLARVAKDMAELLDRRGLRNARVKLYLLGRADDRIDVLLTAEPIEALVLPGPGIAVGLADARFQGATALPGLKTMNYMTNRLAAKEGQARGLDEVLFAHSDGTLTEGSRTTIFMLRSNELVTPDLSLAILPGITRQVVLEVATRQGLGIREELFTIDDLAGADEAFLTGSVSGIRPVVSVEGRPLPVAPGPRTLAIARAYGARIEEEPLLSRDAAAG
ncbi:MAG: aminotransferase class IV [Planctomycetes bacterium]|nr:aminotransferase class IV [Planctomycetota bacterium]